MNRWLKLIKTERRRALEIKVYGKRYCPCSLVRTDDTVCMCKEFREMEEGTCHCQLYIKTKDVDIPSHVDNSTLGYTSKSFKINFKEVEWI